MKIHGFSLVELSIVLIILALVVAGGMTLTTATVDRDHIARTYDEMDEINDALSVFVNEFGRLPCPARLDVARGNAEFGREATDCADASPPSGMTYVEYPASSGDFVRIGGVPFYALGLPDEYLADEWGNRYLYAVADAFVSAVAAGDTGHLEVQNAAAAILSNEAAWVLVSHGETGRGAYAAKGTSIGGACNGSDKDGENCDGDGLFIDTFYDNGSTANSFFDDLVQWETVGMLHGAEPYVGNCSGGNTNGTYGSSCYAHFTATGTWAAQEAVCVAWGGHLATIESAAEQNYLSNTLLGGTYNRTWIGLNDITTEGSYVWVADGSVLGSYNDWGPSQPAGTGALDCISRNDSTLSGKWYDTDCSTTAEAICEKP